MERKEIEPTPDPFENNLYINAHRTRRKNDDDYETYLDWLDKTGGDLPIDKIISREEWNFKQQMKSNG